MNAKPSQPALKAAQSILDAQLPGLTFNGHIDDVAKIIDGQTGLKELVEKINSQTDKNHVGFWIHRCKISAKRADDNKALVEELVEAVEMLKRNDQGVRSPAFNMALDGVFNALAKFKGTP